MYQAIGRADFLEDPRYTTNTDRVAHRAECVDALNEIFAKEPTDHWVKLITAAGIPCGPINRVSDVINNPQVQARNMVVEVPHPEVPNLRIPNSPLKLSGTPATIRRHPPLLGEHNDEILAGAGYDASQISHLREKGVIGVTGATVTPGHGD